MRGNSCSVASAGCCWRWWHGPAPRPCRRDRTGRPAPPGEDLVVDEVLAAAVVDAAEDDSLARPAAGHHPLRHRLEQGAVQQVAEHVGRGRAVADGGGGPAVEHAAGGNPHFDGAKVPGVRREAGVRNHLDHLVDARFGRVENAISRAGHLRVGACKVELDAVARNRDGDLEAYRRLPNAVVVEKQLVLVASIRHPGDRGARPRLGIVEQGRGGGMDRIGAEALEGFLHPSRSHRVGGELGLEIAGSLPRRPGLMRMISSTSSESTPRTASRTGGIRSPSWKMLVQSALSLPATVPPMSEW